MDRYLAIDYGTKRIGLALSDPLKITAQPYQTLPNNDQLVKILIQVVKENSISKIIVGNPMRLNGQEDIASNKVRKFAQALMKHLPETEVVMWDERLTTAEAEKEMIKADVSRGKT